VLSLVHAILHVCRTHGVLDQRGHT